MQVRPGTTYRILDGQRWHIAIGGKYITDGSHRPFEVRVWKGQGKGYIKGVGGPDFTVRVPKLSFYRAWQLRKLGLLAVWKLQSRVLTKVARPS